MHQNVKKLLQKDLYRNISILGFIENYPIEKIYRKNDSLIILGRSDHLWAYISSNNEEELKCLIHKYNYDTKYFASVEKWMRPIICQEHDLEWELVTDRYILPDDKSIDLPERKVIQLNLSHAEYIYNNSIYQEFTSIEYIKECIEKGITAGIIEDGKLVAWGLTHDDRALGALHVLPEYRRRGFAKDITKFLIFQKRKSKEPVFLNVEPKNYKSKNLVKKMGFVFDRQISWLKLK